MRDIEIIKPNWLVWTHCPQYPYPTTHKGCPVFSKRLALGYGAASPVCLFLPWLWIGVVHSVRRG